MNLHQLLEHHGIQRNPFAEEDAQTDPVFKEHCIESIFHPTWDKVFGDPSEPATSIVFGEKGSGKTAMRLQIERHLAQYNLRNPEQRVFVIAYDDFNPLLDRFRERLSGRKRRADRALAEWRLWDHMDAILSLGVKQLVDQILGSRNLESLDGQVVDPARAAHLDRYQARDLLLLAACYDVSTAETFYGRWKRLRKALGFRTWLAFWPQFVGIAGSLLWLVVLFYALLQGQAGSILKYGYLWFAAALLIWMPWTWAQMKALWRARQVIQQVRVGNRTLGSLRQVLLNFRASEVNGQPLPMKRRTDDRYEMLIKFQGILRSLGFRGVFVLVDRVDEPHLINGAAELMKALVWPLLDNKLLSHTGMGVKAMLPIELVRYLDREDRDFHQRARMDKQNVITRFEWTGEALHDVTDARIRACAKAGQQPTIRTLLQAEISDQRLLEAMRLMRVPRHLFKFMYRLLVAHCNKHTDAEPVWQVSRDTFEATLAVFQNEQDAVDRGVL